MGVACEISPNFKPWKQRIGGTWVTSNGGLTFPGARDLPEEVFAVLDQPCRPEWASNRAIMYILSGFNDVEKASFLEIADWIEENL